MAEIQISPFLVRHRSPRPLMRVSVMADIESLRALYWGTDSDPKERQAACRRAYQQR